MVDDTMNAVRISSFGGPEVFKYERSPVPTLSKGEVLVEVIAVGLNPPDWYLRDGMNALPPEWRPTPTFPIILGTDVSGRIAAVADDVTTFAVGDPVYSMVRFPERGMTGAGAYAEYVSVPIDEVAHKPTGIDHIHAAAAPMSLLTAWQFLIDRAHDVPNPLQPDPHVPVPLKGKRVLVNGAAGGVGHYALQIAKWQGAHVIAVASGKNEALMYELGADEFVDHTKTDADQAFAELDLVVDAVGGPTTSRFLKSIKRGGALFPIFSLGFDQQDEADRLGVTVSSVQVRSNGAQLSEVGSLLEDGTIKTVIDSTYPLAEAAKAHERAERGSIQGKIVLTVGAE